MSEGSESESRKAYSGWLEAYPPRGVPTRTYCSESCAERAHVRATRMQWAGNQATVDSSGRCSQCSGAIREIPGWVMDLESRPKK